MLSFHLVNSKAELCQIEGIGKENGEIVWYCETHHVEVEKVFRTKEE